MKRFSCLILAIFALAGCCLCNAPQANLSIAAKYPTGALLAPLPPMMAFRDHPMGKRLMAAPIPQSGGVLPANRRPVLYQAASDCGPCALAAISYPATHQLFSPAATYVWSRQHSTPANWTADNGTYTYANIWVAQNQGQPRVSVWAYPQGNINAIPTTAAVTDAANFKLGAVLTPDISSVESALAGGNAVGLYIFATTDAYYPVALPDGSFEVRTPTTSSPRIGGHFWTAVWYDLNRKMLDGSTGGMLIENSWGVQWGQNGYAWVSIAGWVTSNINGNLSQAYTILAPPLPPAPTLNLTITSPATPIVTVKAGTVVTFAWSGNADKVSVTDSLNHSHTDYPAIGTFITRAVGPQVFTFTATLNSATIVKTSTIAIAP